jgi:hypothetical protein
MLKEFNEFALRGNVVDMAVGIVIGAASSTIVKALVSDVMMPPIGVITGRVDFSNLYIPLSSANESLRPNLKRNSCYARSGRRALATALVVPLLWLQPARCAWCLTPSRKSAIAHPSSEK